MGLARPDIGGELVKFSEVVGEDRPFTLDGIRTVKVKSTEFGEGEMVVMRIRGIEAEAGIWGAYLLAQARSVEPADLGQEYVVTRKLVPEFSDRPVKAIQPTDNSASF